MVWAKAAELRSMDGRVARPHTGIAAHEHLAPLMPSQEHPNQASLLGEEVVEGFYGGEFVVFDVEDGVELGDVEDVVDFFGEGEEFEFAAGVADGGEAADQFADAGGVDVIDGGEVEDDFLLVFGDEAADGVAELAGFVAEGDASGDVDDGDVADFAGGDGHTRIRLIVFGTNPIYHGDTEAQRKYRERNPLNVMARCAMVRSRGFPGWGW